tara:strand:+ start:45 stop:1337 length:1293 start_codon:yes stop_codon:yes gene_type:complete
MMTSRHTHNIEVWDNASPLRSDWPTFAHTFRAAGYRTVLCGKMHFVGPDQLHGFEERWVPDIYPASMEWTRSNREGVAVNTGEQTIRSVTKAGHGETEDMLYDELVVRKAEEGLPGLLDDDRPFILVVSITGPHYPFMAPSPYWEMFKDTDVPLPLLPENFMETEHPSVQWTRKSGIFEELVSDEVCRTARRAIYGRMALADDHLKRVITTLEKQGAYDETIMAFFSDHGDMMGEHGLWYKNTAFEPSSRVPMIFSGPEIAQTRLKETVSLLDLGPTLAGLANIPPLDVPSDGRNLAPLLRGERNEETGCAIVENYGEAIHRGIRTIVQWPYKLNLCLRTPIELFNLEEDPDEWTNVAEEPRYAEIMQKLRSELEAATPDPERYDELRYQNEERRLALLAAIPENERPRWRDDWHETYRQTYGKDPIPKS